MAAGLLTWPGLAQDVQQTIALQPGWNAVFLEVAPTASSPGAVFTNLPVESVWTRTEAVTSAEFVQDPSEAAFRGDGWAGWFPPSRPEAFLSTLKVIQSHRPYLVRLGGTSPAVLRVTGRPFLRPPQWVPDRFTLLGLPVAETNGPTFEQFFRPSPAHYDPAAGADALRVFGMVGGQWQRLLSTDRMLRGQAYWVYTRGASDYSGPMALTVETGEGLEFGETLSELTLRYQNRTAAALTLHIEEQLPGTASALSYYHLDLAAGGQWRPLTTPLALPCAAGAAGRVRLAVRRQAMATSAYASVLQLGDGGSGLWLIPVTAQRREGNDLRRRAGLWVGTATINAVSEVHGTDPTVPTPTASPYRLRLLVHLDGTGQARLLKEVLQMWQEGTTTNDAAGTPQVDRPGRYVLLTDDRLVSHFRGATVRDGTSVGRRLSTTSYEFPGESVTNALPLTGQFAPGQKLTASLTLPSDHPTNPFLHRYHPDHDNRDALFQGPAVESFEVTREIELAFEAQPPPGAPPGAEYGESAIGGTYRETIRDLYKEPIHVRGQFVLTRISLIGELNPNP